MIICIFLISTLEQILNMNIFTLWAVVYGVVQSETTEET